MATVSQVKAGLDDVAAAIRAERQACIAAKARIAQAAATLAGIPTKYADLIATIDAYTPTGEFEALAKDERAKLGAEFTNLKNKADTATTDLAAIDFTNGA